jgi:hypothetical protein
MKPDQGTERLYRVENYSGKLQTSKFSTIYGSGIYTDFGVIYKWHGIWGVSEDDPTAMVKVGIEKIISDPQQILKGLTA